MLIEIVPTMSSSLLESLRPVTRLITGTLFVTVITSWFSTNSLSRTDGFHVGEELSRMLYTKRSELLS